jgi:hypothetical protein
MKPGDPADRATDAKADGAFQGSHRAGYGDRLARVEEWLRKHPTATLASGEGAVLLAEIDRLRVENRELRDIRLNMGRGINMLRADIERVRALHRSGLKGAVCNECEYDHPCPTLRALDGEGA